MKTNRPSMTVNDMFTYTIFKIGYKTLKMITNEDAHPELFNNYQLQQPNRRVVIFIQEHSICLLSIERANPKYGDRIVYIYVRVLEFLV